MALPLHISDVLPRQAPPLRAVPAPPLDLSSEKLEELVRKVANALEEVESFERDVNSSFEHVRESLSMPPDVEPNIDSVEDIVRALRELETKLATSWEQARAGSERTLMRARQLSAREPLWEKYASLVDRLANASSRLLETLRDIRLELAAFLVETDEDLDSPVFEDPEDLKKYLANA